MAELPDPERSSLRGRYGDDRLVTVEPSYNHEVLLKVGNQEPVWLDGIDPLRQVSHVVLDVVYGPLPTELPVETPNAT